MSKSIPFSRTIACVLFLFFLVAGCEDIPQPTPMPKVVTKRIAEQSDTTAAEKEMKPASDQKKPEVVVSPKAEVSTSPQPLAEVSPAAEKSTQEGQAASSLAESSPEASLTDKIADASPRYDPVGKIDPFAPVYKEASVATEDNSEKKIVRRRPLTPLEKIDLSQLKLVGVIRAESGNRALVEDASGKGYVISKGSYVGIYGGRVVQIDKDRAFIEEEVEDIFGKISVSRKELKLQKPPGEE